MSIETNERKSIQYTKPPKVWYDSERKKKRNHDKNLNLMWEMKKQ